MAAPALAAAAALMAVTSPHAAAAPAFSLSASPPAVHLAAGQSTSIRVTDNGSKPLSVSVGLTGVAKSGDAKCSVGGTAVRPSGVAIGGPASFTLAPGKSVSVPVSVAKTAPSQDDAVIFSSDAGGSGNARISGAVGSQLVIGGSAECVSALPASPHSVSAVAVGGLGAALLASVAGARAWVVRRRRRQPAAS